MNTTTMIPGSRQSLLQSKTTDISIELLLVEHDSGYNSSESPTSVDHTIQMNENLVFYNNGYTKIRKLCDTLQGELYKAKINNKQAKNKQNYVAIKKTNKSLFNQQIAIEDQTNFCVSENILKESMILKYLTVDNTPIGGYIAKYIDFFESDTDYYLVMEYIESETNLKQFVSIARKHIENGKLSTNQYQKMMKYLLWQLFVTIQWMHTSMNCCHLDICMQNIMLINANFIETKHEILIDPKIGIKLVDFGVAEVFSHNKSRKTDLDLFLCEKQGLSIQNEGYFAPNVFNGDIFDAEKSDNWSLGMICFETMTVGKCLYSPLDMYNFKSGYWSLHNHELKEYLSANNMLKYFNINSFSLLNGLLMVNERKRLNGMKILKHPWFTSYFGKYRNRIFKKFNQPTQMKRKSFPFYRR